MSKAVEQMRLALHYADLDRKRASALDGLGGLLDCETPGTVSEVAVKRGRWFRRFKGEAKVEEIILSAEERREFSRWCMERAAELRKQADETEARLAGGADA